MLLTAAGLDKKNRIYELTARNTDHLYFKPLPLSSVKSVELEAMSGASAVATFFSRPACCWGLCCCLAVRHLESWKIQIYFMDTLQHLYKKRKVSSEEEVERSA